MTLGVQRGGVVAIVRSITAWIFPQVPVEIAVALHQAQYASVQRQVPMLLGVAALNVIIVMAVCAHNHLPSESYMWMAGLVFYCAARGIFLFRETAQPKSPARIAQLLKINVGLSLGMITGLGLATSITFVTGTFGQSTMIPVSLAFGATSIAHCLYALRPAAIGTLIFGIVPQAIVMICFGNYEAIMLGIATLTVAVLMVRFVAAQYDQLVASLTLERTNHQLANTDPLTGLANRRAIMAALADEESRCRGIGARFGVAQLDLDGFKAVNDSLGHHAGDALLQAVGARLSASVAVGDQVGRLGGDEFVILFRGVQNDADVAARATGLLGALCRPVDIGGHMIPVAASLGHATFVGDDQGVDQLLIVADQALYAAKRAAKATAPVPQLEIAQAA
jgi:diguanylate cyclase